MRTHSWVRVKHQDSGGNSFVIGKWVCSYCGWTEYEYIEPKLYNPPDCEEHFLKTVLHT